MLDRRRAHPEPVFVTVGFAVGSDGKGVAYAAVDCDSSVVPSGTEIKAPFTGYVRVPFALRSQPALQGRDITYAAVNALAETLLSKDIGHVVFRLEDQRLATDLRERGALPGPLTVPYVALRCRLNRFTDAHVEVAQNALVRDLTNRARAEATLDIAA